MAFPLCELPWLGEVLARGVRIMSGSGCGLEWEAEGMVWGELGSLWFGDGFMEDSGPLRESCVVILMLESDESRVRGARITMMVSVLRSVR